MVLGAGLGRFAFATPDDPRCSEDFAPARPPGKNQPDRRSIIATFMRVRTLKPRLS